MPAAEVVDSDFVDEFVRAAGVSAMTLRWFHFLRWRARRVNELRFGRPSTDAEGFVVLLAANLGAGRFKPNTPRQRDNHRPCAGGEWRSHRIES